MTRLRKVCQAMGLLMALLPLDAGAQTAPVGQGGRAPVSARSWAFSLRAQQAWDSNVRFLPGTSEEAFVNRLGASLSHGRRGSKGQISFSGEGDAALYHGLSALNRVNYSGSLTGSYRLSSRAEVTASGGFASTYGREAPLLVDAGLLVPLAVTRTGTGGAGLSYELSPKSTATARIDMSRVSFSSSDLQGGSVVAASAGWSRSLGGRDTLGFSHVYQRSASPGRDGQAQTLAASWTRVVGPRWRASGSLGLSRLASEGASSEIRPYVAASVAARFRRSDLRAQYSRSVSQAFGFGRDRIADLVAAGYSLEAARGLRLSASIGHGVSRDPFDPSFRLTTENYVAGFAWDLARGIGLEGGYAFRRNGSEGSLPAATSHALSLWLSYGRAWGGEVRGTGPGDGGSGGVRR